MNSEFSSVGIDGFSEIKVKSAIGVEPILITPWFQTRNIQNILKSKWYFFSPLTWHDTVAAQANYYHQEGHT